MSLDPGSIFNFGKDINSMFGGDSQPGQPIFGGSGSDLPKTLDAMAGAPVHKQAPAPIGNQQNLMDYLNQQGVG